LELWKVNLYIIWFSQALSLISTGLALPFVPYYIQELGIHDPEKLKLYVGISAAAPAVGMAITAPIWGMVADKYGGKLMVLRAMFFGSLILLWLGLSHNVIQFLVIRFIQGMFCGTIGASSTFIAANTPKRKLSYSLGILSSSTFIGSSAGPAVGGIMAESVGYRASFIIGAGTMFIGFLLVLVLVRENRTEQIADSRKIETLFGKSLLSVITYTVAVMFGLLLFIRIARTAFLPYLPMFVENLRGTVEGSSRVTGFISGFAALMSAISGIIIGRMGDRYNRVKLIEICLATGITVSFFLFFAKGLWFMAIIYGLLMFSIGGIEPLIMSVTSECTPAEKRGVLFGVYTLVSSVGWALAPVMAGFVAIQYSVDSLFILISIMISASLLLLLVFKRRLVLEN
jgi:MFS transporter, DHA1 family, multidrug resistance protein